MLRRPGHCACRSLYLWNGRIPTTPQKRYQQQGRRATWYVYIGNVGKRLPVLTMSRTFGKYGAPLQRATCCRAPTCHKTGVTAPRGSPATLVAGRVARVHPPGNSHGWASRAEATRHPVGLHTAGRYGGGVYATATPTEGVPQLTLSAPVLRMSAPRHVSPVTHRGARHRITTHK